MNSLPEDRWLAQAGTSRTPLGWFGWVTVEDRWTDQKTGVWRSDFYVTEKEASDALKDFARTELHNQGVPHSVQA